MSARRPHTRRAAPASVQWLCLLRARAGLAAAEDGASRTTTASAPAAPPDASATIAQLHETLTSVMRNAEALGFEGRGAAVEPAVQRAYDLEFMARKSLGPHARKLDDVQLARWTDAFGRFLVGNYARQFDGWSGQRFETLGTRGAPHGTEIVATRLTRTNDEDVPLDYRLRPGADGESGWRIIDVYSNGTVSELALRRSEFSSLFARIGFEGLVETVETQAARE